MKNISMKDLYQYGVSHINVSSGCEISIKNLALLIQEIAGYRGNLKFDTSMPDGTPRKILDGSLLKEFGWKSKVELRDGIQELYHWYEKNRVSA